MIWIVLEDWTILAWSYPKFLWQRSSKHFDMGYAAENSINQQLE
jgi:hypothetical protein